MRLEAVIATAGLEETARTTRCRDHDVFPWLLDVWKQDVIPGHCETSQDEQAAKDEQHRVTELNAELHRKDNTLAEPAALLVLKKNPDTLPRRRGHMTRLEDPQTLIE